MTAFKFIPPHEPFRDLSAPNTRQRKRQAEREQDKIDDWARKKIARVNKKTKRSAAA